MLAEPIAIDSPPQSQELPSKPVDWHIVKLLYLQDVPHTEIARNTNTTIAAIRCRAYRERWVETAADPSAPPKPPSISDLVSQFTLNMGLSVVAATRFYANLDLRPTDGEDARQWEAARQTLIASGRALFGLDRDDGKRSAWQSPASGPVIDVTPIVPAIQEPKPATSEPNVSK